MLGDDEILTYHIVEEHEACQRRASVQKSTSPSSTGRTHLFVDDGCLFTIRNCIPVPIIGALFTKLFVLKNVKFT